MSAGVSLQHCAKIRSVDGHIDEVFVGTNRQGESNAGQTEAVCRRGTVSFHEEIPGHWPASAAPGPCRQERLYAQTPPIYLD